MNSVPNLTTDSSPHVGPSVAARRALDRVVALARRSTGADGAALHWEGAHRWVPVAADGVVPEGPVANAVVPATDPLLEAVLRATEPLVVADAAQRWPESALVCASARPRAWAGATVRPSDGPPSDRPRALLSVYAATAFDRPDAGVRATLDDLAALAAATLHADASAGPLAPPGPDRSGGRTFAFVEWRRDGRIRDWNAAAERIFGYTAREARRLDPMVLIPEDERPHVEQVWEAQVAQQGGYFSTNANLTKDGRRIVCEWYNTPLVDADGAVSGVISLVQDVTDREAAAYRLQGSREFAEHLVVVMQDGVLVLDPAGVLIQVNDAFCAMTGFDREALVGTATPHPFWPPEQYRPILDAFERTLRGDFQTVELAFARRDGTRFPVVMSPAQIVNESGDVVSYFATVKDLTDRKRAEAQLAREQELLQHIFDTIPVMIVVDDAATDTIRMNRAMETRIPRGEARCVRTGHRFAIDVDDAAVMRAFVAQLDDWCDLRMAPASGGVIESSWIGLRLSDGTRLGLGIDVTDRKQRERDLEAARDEAQEMHRLKSAFLANMSHEIRTPLTSILGFAEAIERSFDDEADGEANGESELSRHFADLIQRGGRRLLDTLNSVLDLSRLESGTVRLTPRPVDVRAEVQEAVDLFHPRAEAGGIDLRVVGAATPVNAVVDPSALHSVVSNLLGNAVKFTPRDGTIRVGVRADADAVRLEVQDSGIGIDAAFLPRLFNPFEQESTGTGRSHEGSGLGLAVSRQFVDLMGGTIRVRSEKGRGTHFVVTLPRHPGARLDSAINTATDA